MDMESLTINGTISNLNSGNTYTNGSLNTTVMNGDIHTDESNKAKQAAPTYADAFPPLPVAPPSGASADASAWGHGKSSKLKKTTTQAVSKPILSSQSTEVFTIPYEERKFKSVTPLSEDFHRQKDIICDTMKKTGTTIEVSVTRDQCLTVMISGKRDATVKARNEIINKLQVQANISIKIPKEHHRFLLRNDQLKEIQSLTSTKISIPDKGNNNPGEADQVSITGPKEGIDQAKHMIQSISDKQAKLASERLNIPKMYHVFITGPDNEKSTEISNSTGARINIPPPLILKDDITVTGEKEAVQKAVQIIMAIYKEREKICKTVSVEVKKTQHRYVLGPKGAGIKDILRKTGVSVEMPPLAEDNETITLRGDADKLGNALTLVYEKANSTVTSELHAPKWLHRFIIGRKGENIKKITQDLDNKVHIEFIEAEDKIVISGSPNEVQAAENVLETSLRELKNTMSYADIQVDQRWHRHIIGKAGSNITRIKNETGTSINIPSDTLKSNTIRIEGSPEGVAVAKHKILNMAQKMDNEKTRDIIIEHRYHKNIIGQKGGIVNGIRSLFADVQISFPEADANSDVVSLRGPREDVDNCYNHLKKLVSELVLSSYRLDVPIFKRFHGNIIGKNGATIKAIKEETGTTIDIPAENSDSDIIVITGHKENTHKARDKILEIQNSLANIVTAEVKIPQMFHTSLIGPAGKLIQSVITECGGVHIRFPPEGTKSDVITVRGTKEDVEKAQEQLKKLEEERMQNNFTGEVTAKAEHHRFLIGRGGINIRKVREKTGARIIFPSRKDEDQELITIIGTEKSVEEAKKELMDKIKDLNNIVEDELDIDIKYHRNFAARRALVLQDISNEYGGVNISLPKDEKSSKITLKGARDCVEGAKQRLLEMVKEWESNVEVECRIPQKHHGSLLSNRGRDVQELTSRFNVQIKFPDRRKNDEKKQAESPESDAENRNDVIVISGNKDKVEEVKATLLALVPISVEVRVPFNLHRVIIGKGGDNIKKMMDKHKVHIAVPPSDKNDEVIVITGSKERVEATKAAIDVIIDGYHEMTITVPNKYHSNLIGRSGVVIDKWRETYDVKIDVPSANKPLPPGVDPNEIKLTGLEKNCLAVKQEIEEMVAKLEDQITIEVEIDNRCHNRIIGQKGKNVRRLMEKFKVDIRFPRDSPNPDLVLVTGYEDACEQCRDHLLMLEEEYMDGVMQRLEEQSMMRSYSHRRNEESRNEDPYGYVVTDAPWNDTQQRPTEYAADVDSASDFPSLGGKNGSKQQGQAWGPWSAQ